LQVAPSVQLQHGPVGRRRGVVADVVPHGVAGLLQLRLVLDHRNEARARHLEPLVTAPARRRQPLVHRRQDHFAQVARRADAVGDDAVRHLAGDLVHQRPDCSQEDAGGTVRMRGWREDGCHQRVRVELALELQGDGVVPRCPDRPQGEHVLPHACRGVRPRGTEPLLNVPSHLRPHPQHDAPGGVLLQLVGRVRHAHGVAGEGHGDPGPEGHRRRVLGGQRQRQKRIVCRLGRPDAVQPGGLGGGHPVGHRGQLRPQTAVDLHRVRPLTPTPMPRWA
jgi:hypothetical protein